MIKQNEGENQLSKQDIISDIIDHSIKICSICVDANKKITVSDCNGDCVNLKSKYTENLISPNRTLNIKYSEKRSKDQSIQGSDYSTVWVLIGENESACEVIQVGQIKSLERMNDELNTNRNAIIFHEKKNMNYNKYAVLLDFYRKLTFYEVKLDEYFGDEEFAKLFNTLKFNHEDIFYYVKSLCVEGKIAALTKAKKWHSSGGIDSFVYGIYKLSPEEESP